MIEQDFLDACKKGDISTVSQFNGDFNCHDEGGNTALIISCNNGQTKIVKLLIAKGANLEIKNNKGINSLFAAIIYNRKEIAELLIAEGVDLSIKGINNATALDCAITLDRNGIAKNIIDGIIDINILVNGRTYLSRALSSRKRYYFNALIEKGANPNIKDKDGDSVLLKAADNNDIYSLNVLLDLCSIETKEDALWQLIGTLNIVSSYLVMESLSIKTDINDLLHASCLHNNESAILFFYEKGANFYTKYDGYSAYDSLCEKENLSGALLALKERLILDNLVESTMRM